jgi:hypothetical protein
MGATLGRVVLVGFCIAAATAGGCEGLLDDPAAAPRIASQTLLMADRLTASCSEWPGFRRGSALPSHGAPRARAGPAER